MRSEKINYKGTHTITERRNKKQTTYMFQQDNEQVPTVINQLRTLSNITTALNQQTIQVLEEVDNMIKALTQEHREYISALQEQGHAQSPQVYRIQRKTEDIQRRAFMLVHILTLALSNVNAVRCKYLRQSDDAQERVRNNNGSLNNPTEQDKDSRFPPHGPNENNQEEPDTHHPVVHVINKERNPRLLGLADIPPPQANSDDNYWYKVASRREYQNPQDVEEETDSDSLPSLETHHTTDLDT